MSEEIDVQELLHRMEIMEHTLGLYYYIPQADVALEELIGHLDHLSLQLVLRAVDAKDLSLAMMGFQPKTLSLVKAAVSKNSWEMLRDDVANHAKWVFTGNPDKLAQLKMVNLIKKMELEGKITIPGSEALISARYLEQQKQAEEEKAAKIKYLEVWKKEVFDPLG